MINGLLMVILLVTAVFLVLLVLIQRGKGGGLAGALGGMGGQSAFGTKAGDLFTRITIGVAFFWIIMCSVAVNRFGQTADLFSEGAASEAPAGEETVAPLVPDASEGGASDGGATPAPEGATDSSLPAEAPPASEN